MGRPHLISLFWLSPGTCTPHPSCPSPSCQAALPAYPGQNPQESGGVPVRPRLHLPRACHWQQGAGEAALLGACPLSPWMSLRELTGSTRACLWDCSRGL